MSVEEALEQKKGKVNVRGWVYQLRNLKDKIFVVLRDPSNTVQCIIDKKNKEVWKTAEKLTIESSIEVGGEIYEDKRAPTGYEILVKKLNVIQIAEKYPIPVRKQYHSPELLLDYRHLWIRDPRMQAILKIRSTVIWAIHDFFRRRGYYEFSPPMFQPMQCEGGSTLFELKYFDKKTFLAQTWQLYAEAAIFSLGKVYDVAPVFRAEKSKTSRHLSEFWMAEMEAAWMELPELIEVAKEEVRFIINEVLEKNKKELEFLGRDIKLVEHYGKADYPTITYKKALELLNKKYKMKIKWGKDLRTIEESKIADHFNAPVVVTNYPKEIMAFYKPKDPKDKKTALCFDMIVPEGYCEIIGGSQRDIDAKEITRSLKALGENPKNYKFYFDLRKYGSVPHSGYGLGVERLVAWICGIENIRDSIGFPRTMLRCNP
jgi:asparaginyl-tRNA synthetase